MLCHRRRRARTGMQFNSQSNCDRRLDHRLSAHDGEWKASEATGFSVNGPATRCRDFGSGRGEPVPKGGKLAFLIPSRPFVYFALWFEEMDRSFVHPLAVERCRL